MLEYTKNIQKQQIQEYFEKFLFIFSLMPLILNWIAGIYFLKDNERKTYIYRSFIASWMFLIISSILYLIYVAFIDVFSSNINIIFFILQVVLVLFYLYISIIQILSFYKKEDFYILKMLDSLYSVILEYL